MGTCTICAHINVYLLRFQTKASMRNNSIIYIYIYIYIYIVNLEHNLHPWQHGDNIFQDIKEQSAPENFHLHTTGFAFYSSIKFNDLIIC
jgi:hypothetical protein